MKQLKYFGIKTDEHCEDYFYHPELNSQYEYRQESDMERMDQMPKLYKDKYSKRRSK